MCLCRKFWFNLIFLVIQQFEQRIEIKPILNILLKRSLYRTKWDLNYPEIRYKCAIVHKYFCNRHRNRKIKTVEENDLSLKITPSWLYSTTSNCRVQTASVINKINRAWKTSWLNMQCNLLRFQILVIPIV